FAVRLAAIDRSFLKRGDQRGSAAGPPQVWISNPAIGLHGAHCIWNGNENDVAEQVASLTLQPGPNPLLLATVREGVGVGDDQDAIGAEPCRHAQPDLTLAPAPRLGRQRAPDTEIRTLDHVQRAFGIMKGIGKTRSVEYFDTTQQIARHPDVEMADILP